MCLTNFILNNATNELGVRVDMFRADHPTEGMQLILISGAYSSRIGSKPRHRITTIGYTQGSDTKYVATTSRRTLKRVAALVDNDRAEYLGWTTVLIDGDGDPEQSNCRDIYDNFIESDALEDSADF